MKKDEQSKGQSYDELEFEDLEIESETVELDMEDDEAQESEADLKFEEEWESEDDWEPEEEWESEEEEEESGLPSKGVMVLSVLILFVVAAIICAVLWRFTHSQRDAAILPAEETMQETGDDITTEAEKPPVETVPGTEALETPSPQPSAADTAPTDSETHNTEGNQPSTTASPMPTPLVEANEVYEEPVSGDASMTFQEVSETVMAKDVTNIRSVPNTADAANVLTQLMNGENVTRTGINADTGWSRLDYNGQTAYAVSQYLTTDLNYTPPVQASNPNRINTQDGRVIIFEDWNDYVTPKEYVNLRTEPSTSEGNATVNCQVSAGTVLHRTGRSGDSGWSRVEYNGSILYVVSNYMVETQESISTSTPVEAPVEAPVQ